YSIVNLPKRFLPQVFREVERVLGPGGCVMVAFHTGDEVIAEKELWGHAITMDFVMLPTKEICGQLEDAGLVIEEVVERDAYPDVEYPSHRAYVFARKKWGGELSSSGKHGALQRSQKAFNRKGREAGAKIAKTAMSADGQLT